MKPFDLELAKLGHPLVTGDGQEVTDFYYFETADNKDEDYPCGAVIGGRTETFTKLGEITCHNSKTSFDLFLKDCDWQPKLRMGDEIECSDDGKNWQEQIFVTEINNVILTTDKEGFTNIERLSKGIHGVSLFSWKHTRRISKSPLNEVPVSDLIAELNKRTGSNLVIDSMNDDGITIKSKE